MLRIQSMKFQVNIQYTAVVVTCDRLVHRLSLSKLSFGIYKTQMDKISRTNSILGLLRSSLVYSFQHGSFL